MNPARRSIGVLVALREELRAIEPGLRGLPAVAGRTGIGKKNANLKAAAFLDEKMPALLIVAGFAGGLAPGLAPGDILVASEVCDQRGGPGAQASWVAPPALLAAAAALPLLDRQLRIGRLVTVDKVLSSASRKEELRLAAGADAADMESSAVLEAAAARGIPAICVRSILDEAGFDLPFDFGRILTPAGRPRVLGAIGAVASNPTGIARFPGLVTRAWAAARSLGEYIPRLVEALS